MKINCSVVVAGIVQNCGVRLQTNIHLAQNFISGFETGKIIIYENNSTDRTTRAILEQYTAHPDFIIRSEDTPELTKETSKAWAYTEVTGSDHPCRIEKIANARNRLLDMIQEYGVPDYLVLVDMDSLGWSVVQAVSAIAETRREQATAAIAPEQTRRETRMEAEEWDVLYANGVTSNGSAYYDLYALRMEPDYALGPEVIGDTFWSGLKYFKITTSTQCLLRVSSAFGGLGIYKKPVIHEMLKIRYDCSVTPAVVRYYTSRKDSFDMGQKCDKFPNGFLDSSSGIFFKANSGYDAPVVCEHVSMNLALAEKFRLFIHPKITYVHSG